MDLSYGKSPGQKQPQILSRRYLWVISYPQESHPRTPAIYHGYTGAGVHPIVPWNKGLVGFLGALFERWVWNDATVDERFLKSFETRGFYLKKLCLFPQVSGRYILYPWICRSGNWQCVLVTLNWNDQKNSEQKQKQDLTFQCSDLVDQIPSVKVFATNI